MRTFPLVSSLVLALAAALPSAAQEAPAMSAEEKAMMEAYQQAGTPGPQHAAMARSAGDYTLSVTSWQAPDAPPTVESGKARRRMDLGGRVLIEEVESTMMGQAFTGMGLHGYDNVSGKYWSTWNDSMSTGLMVSQGDCDDQGNCTFTGSWNDPVTRDKVTARMTTRWTDANTEIFEMYGPGPDGKEMKMMQITYTRTNP
ncbi:DUF1579 domain-containing protein [Arenimonas donghaensis]|uniref:DUF1579 domain-containing protein n=1 Tax=Arenimonas donghaensis DSM 18148 = HO3-R19 TaxID=1121014 RepID=A0A087MLI3_9GAMM|nr:DUF1579 domain-containing protein [Arenimonas donghaensis]KFL37736.1 hypothetical protein N788_00775 [Arenimonas donghaensis DSM 18148 = HO3-R19]